VKLLKEPAPVAAFPKAASSFSLLRILNDGIKSPFGGFLDLILQLTQ